MSSSITFDLQSFWSAGLALDVGLWWRTLILLGGRPCIQTGHWVANLMVHLLGESDDMLKEGDDILLGGGQI